VLGINMGLNHMNGRVEDSIIGRFLSPDPTITDKGNPQNYNRYSYVLNNPLTYVDPSGFATCEPGASAQHNQFCVGSPVESILTTDGPAGEDYKLVPSNGYSTYGYIGFGSDNSNSGTDNDINPTNSGNAASGADTGAAQSQLAGGSGCYSLCLDSGTQNTFAPNSFVAPAVGVGADVAAALGYIAITIGGIFVPDSNPGGGNDVTQDTSQAYVFHFATDAKMAAIQAAGAITPSASQGVAWVTPTPYTSAALAQSQLALPNTPAGFYAIPVQNLQTPLSWSTVQPNFGQPGGGVEGTTPLSISISGAFWVAFPH
jgi:RHS repeat-associated protein